MTPSAPSPPMPYASQVHPEGNSPSPSSIPVPLLVVAGMVLPAILAYSLVTTSEARVLAVLLGLMGVLAIIARPFWGLLFFVGLLYTRPEESIPALAGMRLPLMISIVTLTGYYLHVCINRQRLARSPAILLLFGFALWAIAGAATGGLVSDAIQELMKLVILFLLVLNLVRTPEQYGKLSTAIIVCTTYLSLFSIYLFFNGGAMAYQGMERSKGTGIFGDPNDLSAAIVAGMALALVRIPKGTMLSRIAYGVVTGIMTWAILLTGSRGGMLALLAVLGGFFFISTKRKGLAMAMAGVVVVLFMALGPSRMTSFDSSESSANSRFWFWSSGVDLLVSNPIMGITYGTFPDHHSGYTAHNTFVLCFTELGLPGYFCWMGIVYYCYRRRTRSDTGGDGDPEPTGEPLVLLGARLALAGFFVGAFFLSRTYTPTTYLLMSLPIAAQWAMAGPAEQLRLEAKPSGADVLRILGISLGSILFIKIFADFLR